MMLGFAGYRCSRKTGRSRRKRERESSKGHGGLSFTLVLKSAPERCAASDRRPFHDDKAGALQQRAAQVHPLHCLLENATRDGESSIFSHRLRQP